MNGKLLLNHMVKWKMLYAILLLTSLTFVGVNAFNEYKPTVMSDKDDYAPGEVAIIAGYGWTQDQYVDIHFQETPEFHVEHQHDFHNIKVDGDGKWMITYQIEERHLGVKFDVTVEGHQSKAVAHTTFTDANVSFNASGLPSGTQVKVLHKYTAASNGTMLESTTFTTPNTSSAIASANNKDVFFSYPQTLVAGGKTYQITTVTATNNGVVESGSEEGYDYKFNSPAQARTITANYKKSTSVSAANSSGQQGGTVTLSANLKESGSNLSGKQIRFTFNGTALTGTTNNGGNATVTANIGNLAVGSYTYTAAFLEDADFAGSSATGNVTVTSACTAPAIANHPTSTSSNFTYGSDAAFSVTASGTAPFSYQWQVNTGNGFANIDGATSATLTVTQPSVSMNGFQYQCIVTNSCGTVTSNSATLNIKKATATVNLTDLSYVYDGNAKSASVSTNAPGISSFNITYDGASDIPVNYKNGGYAVVATLVNDNFSGIANGTLVIGKAEQLIAWESPAAIIYGTALSATQLNASALGGAELTYVPDAGSVLNAGDHTLTVSAAESNNYKAASREVKLVVNKATATLVLGDLTHTYDGNVKSATVTTSPSGLLGVNISNNDKINADTYEVIATLDNNNYEAASVKGDLKINPRAITVTTNANQSKVYGTAEPSLTYEVTNGSLVNASHLTGALARTPGDNVGTYSINKGSLAATSNYELTFVGADFEITRRSVAVTADALSKVYGAADPVLTYEVSSGSLVGSDAFSGELRRVAGENVNTYVVELGTLSLGNNYNLSLTEGTVFSITQKAITVTPVAGQNKVYGSSDPAFNYTASADLVGTDKFTGALSRVAGQTVGAYAITKGSLALNSNYTLDVVENVTFQITPKSLVASIEAFDKVYDGTTAASATGSVPAADVVAGDLVEVTVTGANFVDKNVGTGINVVANVAISNTNYSLSNTEASVKASITAKGLTAVINASDKEYDGNRNAMVNASIFEGLVSGDNVSATASNALFDTKNVGATKPVSANISISGEDAHNYSVNSTASATAAITAKPITVAAEAKGKVYGNADPLLTYTTAPGSILEGDGFSGAMQRVEGENVGTYAIQQHTLSAGSNYSVTFEPAMLTISQRSLAVTAAAKQKMLGQADPALTYSVTSGELVFNDTFSGSLERESGETTGVYAINKGSLSAGDNYNLSYTGADLTIHQLPVVAIVNPAPVQYSTAINVTANFTGIVTNPVWMWGFTANTNGVINTPSISGSATAPLTPGVYTLVLQYKDVVGGVHTTEPVFISVFDPEGGFVTGGGWINSPAGALDGTDVTGKANFGFVAKYKKGKNEVEGNTEFQFQAGAINFKSSAHDVGSLVISGAKATYKGVGTIAGYTGTYNFMVVATDGQINGGGDNDKFRIKIWNGGNVLYDNARGELDNAELGDNAILGGGSIVIHEVKAVTTGPKSSKVIFEELTTESSARFDNYPNAFSDRTTIRFAFDDEQRFVLEVYDIRGALVKRVAAGNAEAGKVYEYELDARNLAEGVYFAKLATGSKMQTIKMLLKK